MLLDPRIEESSIHLCELALSELRLQKDGELDWLILIPKGENLTEWTDLTSSQQAELTAEIDFSCRLLKACGELDKLNIGALGNIVSQLHIHIIGRQVGDRAWPGPIWGTKTDKPLAHEREMFWREKALEFKKQFYKVV